MKVLLTGSNGFIGSALVDLLSSSGHEIIRLVRQSSVDDPTAMVWDPESAEISDSHNLEALDAVIHLAGENVATDRWTPAKKARIRNSRVKGTGLLARTMAQLSKPPQVFASTSAIGIYGDRADEILSEDSGEGKGFLAEVCRDWEAATKPVQEAGIRVVCLRIGMVLSSKGGALAKMVPLFKLGLGGVLGNGRQYYSWISLHDTVRAIRYAVEDRDIEGPVNLVAPHPVTNKVFTKTLGRTLVRPTLIPAPAFALRFILGEMAGQLLLSSTRVKPSKLLDSGFHFEHTDLETTLKQLLKPVTP